MAWGGGGLVETEGKGAPSSATSLLWGWQGQPMPSLGVLLQREGM